MQTEMDTDTTNEVMPEETTTNEVEIDESNDGDVEPAPPQEFNPDFKFKYFGNEGEIPEDFRAFITDQEKQEKLKEIARKAASFDYMRETSKIDDFKGESFIDLLQSKTKIDDHYRPLEERYNQITQRIQQLDAHVNSGDYGTFFDNLNLKKDDIIKWAAQELAMREATPEQRQQFEMQRQAQTQQATLQYQNQMYQQQLAQQAVQTRTMEVQNELAKPEVNEFVQKFDAIRGPGAFFNEVRSVGANEWSTRQVDLPAGEAVRRVMDAYRPFFTNPTTPQQTTTPNQTVVTPPQQKATIPSYNSSGKSPVRHKVRSLDDIRRIAAQMES